MSAADELIIHNAHEAIQVLTDGIDLPGPEITFNFEDKAKRLIAYARFLKAFEKSLVSADRSITAERDALVLLIGGARYRFVCA